MHQVKERKSVVLNSQANSVCSIKTLFTSRVYNKDLHMKIIWRWGISIRLVANSTARRNVTLSILNNTQVVSCPKLSDIRKSVTLSQGSPASPSSAYPFDKSSIRTKKSKQHLCIDTDRGKPKYSVPIPVCPPQFSHGLAGWNPGHTVRGSRLTNCLNHGTLLLRLQLIWIIFKDLVCPTQ
jgi:hypothetical protein